jgi:hypothetical protein
LEYANDTKRRNDGRYNSDVLDSIPTNDNFSDVRFRGTGFSDDKRRDISGCSIILI